MVSVSIDGGYGMPSFHDALDKVRAQKDVVDLVFICVPFCEEAIEELTTLLTSAKEERQWRSIMISNCSGMVDVMIHATLHLFERVEIRGIPELDETIATAIRDSLKRPDIRVKKLRFSIMRVDKAMLQTLEQGVTHNSSVNELHFNCCQFVDDDAHSELKKVLLRVRCLRTLHLDSCQLLDDQVANIVALCIRFHPDLEELVIPYNQCGRKTYASIGRMLNDTNCNLRVLDCGRQQGHQARSKQQTDRRKNGSSRRRKGTKTASLSDACETESMFWPITSSIASNESLEVLNLSYSEISDADIGVLAEALVRNYGIKELRLCGSQFGETGVKALAQSLPHWHNIERLWLTGRSRDQFGEKGSHALVVGLQRNMSLIEVFLPQALPELKAQTLVVTDMNRGGRRLFRDCDRHRPAPIALWPDVLAKANTMTFPGVFSDSKMHRVQTRRASVIYNLLREKVLLELHTSHSPADHLAPIATD